MIRGIDPSVRDVIKSAAKAEGISIGKWVRRALQRALETAAQDQTDQTRHGPAGADAFGARMRALEARVDALEQAHRNPDHSVPAVPSSIDYSQSKDSTAWLLPKKSRSS
jgi:hypothetical protein